MRKCYFILFIVLFSNAIYCQTSPDWLWAIQTVGTSGDNGYSIASDNTGNSYITGVFSGTLTIGSFILNSNGGADIFIAKINPAGVWIWAIQVGGTGNEESYAIAVDNNANVYLTGYYTSINIAFGSISLTIDGGQYIFTAKMDTNGNWLWAKKAGNGYNYAVTGLKFGGGIAIDNNGNCYITGSFCYRATFGSTSLVGGRSEAFIAKLNTNGSWLWAKRAGGSYYDYGFSIALDSSGNSYLTGSFQSSATFGTTTLSSSGADDIFVAKLNSSGTWLWAKRAGGTGHEYGYGISTSPSGDIYVTGYVDNGATFGATTLNNNGVFVTKLDSNGNWLWAKCNAENAWGWYWSYTIGNSITTDSNGNCYTTGSFLITKLDTNGNWLWTKQTTSQTGDIWGSGISIDSIGNLYVTGSFYGGATFDTNTILGSGLRNTFVVKLAANVTPIPIITNLTAIQRSDNSKKVDIYFDVFHNMPITISIQASNDNGVTWTFPCSVITGDVGTNISPGTGKHIVWDVFSEHPNISGNEYRFKIIADDGRNINSHEVH